MAHPTTEATRPVALVTGSTQGIGRAVALRLAAEGYCVGVNGRVADDRMAALVAEIDGFAAPADIADPEAVRALINDVEAERGPITALVCNAAYMSMAPFVEHDEDDWWQVVDTNLGGTFHAIRCAVPGMRRAGGGSVVVVTSEWGVVGWPRATAYAASKAGLISLVKCLGRELAPEGIIVNAIAPGVIDTPQLLVDASDLGVTLEEVHARYAAETPVERIGRPDEIAAAVAMLCCNDLGALVGQTLQINGGTTRCRV